MRVMICSYLNDLITRKFQEWDVGGVTSHEIAIQDSKNAFVGNDEQIVLLSLQFENHGLKADSEVMIRLLQGQPKSNYQQSENSYLGTGIPMMVGIKLMLCDLIRPLGTDASFRHLLTDTRVELTHLRALSDLVSLVVEVLGSLYGTTSSGRPYFQWS
jgi:hypothetical protein